MSSTETRAVCADLPVKSCLYLSSGLNVGVCKIIFVFSYEIAAQGSFPPSKSTGKVELRLNRLGGQTSTLLAGAGEEVYSGAGEGCRLTSRIGF